MARKSGLSLFCYLIRGDGSVVSNEYAEEVTNLSMNSVAPGGYGTLTATLKFANTLTPRPELGLLARVAVLAGQDVVWLGEISDAPKKVDDQDESITFSALGIGNWLRDDPQSTSYTSQTMAQILTTELSNRAAYSILSSDLSQVVPTNAATVYSPAYAANTLEEVINDLVTLDGDDYWGVECPVPTEGNPLDAGGIPKARLVVHARDLTTVSYRASFAAGEISAYSVAQDLGRCYNVVQIQYQDASQSPPVGVVTYSDPRLAGSGAQSGAPFRRRVFYRSMTGVNTATKALCQTIANTYGAQMQNITNKVSFTLRAIRDNNGAPLDLWRVMADGNIAVPELYQGMSTWPTAFTAGGNEFYIMSATYSESDQGDAHLTLECDNYADRAEILIARLTAAADYGRRVGAATTGVVQLSGANETGVCGFSVFANAASQVFTQQVMFRAIMTKVPISVTLSSTSLTNATSFTVSNITVYGFRISFTSSGSGVASAFGIYTTSGN